MIKHRAANHPDYSYYLNSESHILRPPSYDHSFDALIRNGNA
jgi:hypothetical protein